MNALNIIIVAAPISTTRNAPNVSAGSQRFEETTDSSATGGNIFGRSGARGGRGVHDIIGAALHLVIHATQVFAEHTDADQLYTADEKEQRHQRCETGLSDLDAR